LLEPIRLVPYPYAFNLVKTGIRLVDRIAGATEIAKALNNVVTDRTDGPLDELPFTAEIRERVAALG
jgi:hypothetical protein